MTRTAIITGGASGIGAAVAEELVHAGTHVLLADLDGARAEERAVRLNGAGPGRADAAEVDVCDAATLSGLVDRFVDDRGPLDLMFNNAGIGLGGHAHDLDLAHWNRTIDVNLRGVIHGIHAALPGMVREARGQIVNTASLAGLIPSPLMAPYAATKHAVVGLTLSLRVEYARQGVGFSVVCPGYTDTDILDGRTPRGLSPVASQPDIRASAERLPGGVYPVALLAQDIVAGIQNNEAMIVAPESARVAWHAWRRDPDRFLERLSQAELSSEGPDAGPDPGPLPRAGSRRS